LSERRESCQKIVSLRLHFCYSAPAHKAERHITLGPFWDVEAEVTLGEQEDSAGLDATMPLSVLSEPRYIIRHLTTSDGTARIASMPYNTASDRLGINHKHPR
jgi:hypothetical protein